MIAAVVVFIGGGVAIERLTITRLLHDDAVSTGRKWTEFLAKNIGDLSQIVAEAIEAGEPTIEAKQGEPPSRPAFYSEAYIPSVGSDGKVKAVVETYIDQTEKRAQFEQAFNFAAVLLGLLIAAAFGLPAGAWYFRKRDQEHSDARIHYLANFDTLSGLANRTRLADELVRALAELMPAHKLLAVHCVDIDRFKDINDRLGLGAGDLMIKIAAERLNAVAGPEDIVARLAGDEFALIQRAPRDRADAEVFARKISGVMAAPVLLGGEQVALTVCVGVALAPDHGSDPERLVKSAELALAKGKSEGRSRIRFFSDDLDSEVVARLRLESAIETALATDGFALHFQPLYAEPGETLVGFEALARLQTPDGDFIPPTEFIPVAERMGVIGRLGAWVLREACDTAIHWPQHLTVSVNLSPVQFGKDGNIVDVTAAALAASGLQPSRLLLEITESLLLKDSEGVMAELAKLKALGVSIVMDDFGTGYSSLSYLWQFPFDKIKIDQSFMRAFDAPGAPAEKIVRTIAALGHAMGMQVCVEGVETERHAAYARASGCDEVQGFHFGRPMPVTEVAATILADFRGAAVTEHADQQAISA